MKAIRLGHMEKMDIRPISVVEDDGQVRARLNVRAPAIGVRVWLEVRFRTPANSNRAEWAQEAYDRALSVLDPA